MILGQRGNVLQTLKQAEESIQSLIDRSDCVLLAFSGGIDSLALFEILKSCQQIKRFDLQLVHVDHKVRSVSTEEAECLKQHVENQGFVFHLLTRPGDDKHVNENDLRNYRYEAISKVYKDISADKLFTAHHADDQVETVLKRFFEGSFLFNLKGLSDSSKLLSMKVYRPLLHIRKNILKEFLIHKNLSWIEDETNRDKKYLRSKMRMETLPLIENSFGKSISNNLLEFSSRIKELERYFDQKIGHIEAKETHGPLGICLDCHEVCVDSLELEFWFRKKLKDYSWTFSKERVKSILESLLKEKSLSYSMGPIYIVTYQKKIFIMPNKPKGSILLNSLDSSPSQREKTVWKNLWKGFVYFDEGFSKKDLIPYKLKSKSLESRFSKQQVPPFLRKLCYIKKEGQKMQIPSPHCPNRKQVAFRIHFHL